MFGDTATLHQATSVSYAADDKGTSVEIPTFNYLTGGCPCTDVSALNMHRASAREIIKKVGAHGAHW